MGIFKQNTKVPEFTGLQINTSCNALPVPIIYGTPRCTVNLLYFNGFRSAPVTAGGKGLLTSGKTTGQFNYFATIIMALGEGPLGPLELIYQDQAIFNIGAMSGADVVNMPVFPTVFPGAFDQGPWPWIVANWSSDALSYARTAYIGLEDYPLDASATVPQFNVVVKGVLQGTVSSAALSFQGNPQIFPDADPALMINDFLTNVQYGIGFPAEFIDPGLFSGANATNPALGDAAYQTYCAAVGPLGFSVVLDNVEQGSSILERWCKLTNTAAVWTGLTLKFIPYGDQAAGPGEYFAPTGSVPAKYFTPNLVSVASFTDADFLEPDNKEDDPIELTRIDLADVYNIVRMDVKDRGNQFNDNVVEAADDNARELFGPRVELMGLAKEFGNMAIAAVSAQLQVQRNVSIRNTVSFKLGLQWCILDPMDVIQVTDASLGLDQAFFRIIEIQEDSTTLALTVTAEEMNIGSATATAYPKQLSSAVGPPLVNMAPGSVNTPAIFEPPSALRSALGISVPTIFIGLSGGPSGVFNPNWAGADVYASTDGVTYAQQGSSFVGRSTMGVLNAGLASYGGANPDIINGLGVDLRESEGSLTTVTSGQAAAFSSLCVVIDAAGTFELLSYETATLTGANQYTLTNLYRGLYGTTPAAHIAGAQFFLLGLGGQFFQAPFNTAFIGLTIDLKFSSFNALNSGHQDLTTLTVYPFTLT